MRFVVRTAIRSAAVQVLRRLLAALESGALAHVFAVVVARPRHR